MLPLGLTFLLHPLPPSAYIHSLENTPAMAPPLCLVRAEQCQDPQEAPKELANTGSRV